MKIDNNSVVLIWYDFCKQKFMDLNTVLAKLSGYKLEHAIVKPFACYDDREFENILGAQNQYNSNELLSEIPICETCKCQMAKFDLRYVCENCGCEEEILGDDTDAAAEYYVRGGTTGNNSTGTSSAPLRINGPGAHMLQKKLIGSVSDYKVQQRKNTVEDMTNINYQYNGPKLPNDVILAGAELYCQVQQFEILRQDVRKGTQAACVYRKCSQFGITRKPKEIADMWGITQTDLSAGEKILDKLEAEGKIESTPDQRFFNADKEIENFTDRYFEDLNIPFKKDYKNFVTQLIRFTLDKHIADSSVPSSKCAGAIYILTQQCEELGITWNEIQTKCKISKSTFTRFAKTVMDVAESSCDAPAPGREHLNKCGICRQRQQLRHIFKKNNILL